MKARFLFLLVLAAPVTIGAQAKTPPLRPISRTDHVEMQDANGQVVFWVDGWGRIRSPVASELHNISNNDRPVLTSRSLVLYSSHPLNCFRLVRSVNHDPRADAGV